MYFLAGYFLYASIFAAIGAAIDNQADAQQFMMPITILVIVALYVGILTVPEDPNGIVAQIFGTKYLSTLFGIVFLSHQFGAFAGAFLGGYFYDLFGSYDYAWYIAIVLSLFATLIHLPIDEKPIVRTEQTI